MKLLFTFTGLLDPLMQQMAAKYERYRQWLAKIMGKDPETFSDKEIKVCMLKLKYLTLSRWLFCLYYKCCGSNLIFGLNFFKPV